MAAAGADAGLGEVADRSTAAAAAGAGGFVEKAYDWSAAVVAAWVAGWGKIGGGSVALATAAAGAEGG